MLQEFSIPLLLGVVVALVFANTAPKEYDKIVNRTYEYFTGESEEKLDSHQIGENKSHDGEHGKHEKHDEHSNEHHKDEDAGDKHNTSESESSHDSHGGHHEEGWKHYATLLFVINDIFMVIFFGIAAKEITESCLPGGALNPPAKAINPLLGTIGGVLGPVGAYFILNATMGAPEWRNGWGIPTATDIALAWLIARMVFGTGHPAVSFLLLLAVADDGIGLGIIAFAYPNPDHPTVWANTAWILPGIAIAYGLRKMNIQNWIPYILFGGAFSWWGLYSAGLHPALALVPIVPFLPGPDRDAGIFREEAGVVEHNPLDKFEHDLKLFVDFGLFFFAFANAGVQFNSVNNLTWIVLLSLLVGKTVGITAFSYGGALVGFPLPQGMRFKHLLVAGIVAGLGLTVALFVAGQAFKGQHEFEGAAKMGALFSAGIAFIAIFVGRTLKVNELTENTLEPDTASTEE